MPEGNRSAKERKRAAASGPIQSELGRQQPQAVDFEAAVIGACLIEQDAFAIIADTVKAKSFYDTKHQLIFGAIQTLAGENRPVDILTVTEKLRANGELEEAGGPYYLAELSQKVLSSAHILYHAQIIAAKALARQLISYTSRVQERAFDEGEDINQLMQDAEGQLFELSKNNMKKDFTQIDPVVKEAVNLLQKASANKSGMSGLSSGFYELDKMTNGWQRSDLVIIAARPAMGKTAFVLSMAKNIAVDQRVPVAMFSLEMSNVQLVNRLLTNVCQIPGNKIKSGDLATHEWGQLDMGVRIMEGAPLYIDDTPSLSVFELKTKARRLVNEHHVELIIIDYLQLMNASGMSYGNRQEEVSTISRSLKGLAKELNIPIIALSQLNRSVETRISTAAQDSQSSMRPQLSDLRESGAIEQDADMVCFIHRPDYYKIKTDQHGNSLVGLAEIIIAKHRNGAVGDVQLRFIGEYARFANIDEPGTFKSSDGEVPDTIVPSRMNSAAINPDDPINSLTEDMAPPF